MSTPDPAPPSSLDFAAVRFSGPEKAYEVFAEARDRDPRAPWAHQVGFVERHHDGHLVLRGEFGGHYVAVDESAHFSGTGAAEGAVIGGLIGILGGPPGIAVGFVSGGLAGSLIGKPTETETEPAALVEELRDAMARTGSALVMIGPAAGVDEVLAAVEGAGGDVTRHTLTAEQAAALEASLADSPTA